MAFDITDYVKRANDVRSYPKLNNLTDGKYTMLIKDILFREDKLKTSLYFIVKVEIVTAEPVRVLGELSKPNLPGEQVNVYTDLKGLYDGGSKDMIKFTRALHGLKADQLTADQMNQLIGEMAHGTDASHTAANGKIQPCRGMLIGNTTTNRVGEIVKMGANAGKPRGSFAQSNWSTIVEGNDKESVAARRAKLGGGSLPG